MAMADYSHEKERLRSFRHWPSKSPLKPDDLAKEGFYYTGIRDQGRCFACKRLFEMWRPGEDMQRKHAEASPECPIVRSRSNMAAAKGGDVDVDDMSSEAGRLATFRKKSFKWPRDCPIKPVELAKAGFYFTGRRDMVECHVCHVQLKLWKPGDTAEGEHRFYSPLCPIVAAKADTKQPKHPPPLGRTPQRRPASPLPERKPYLEKERLRLLTFEKWPRSIPVSPHDLAEAGFYYTGRRDAVRCFNCHVYVEQWMPGDVPVEEHVKHSPNCQFAQSVLHQKERAAGPLVVRNASAEKSTNYAERLATFQNWPPRSPISAESLAEAGFCYMGEGDRVRCATCGGGLRGWERGDEAWGEHLRHFPACKFVMEHFGLDTAAQDEPWHEPKQQRPPEQESPEPLDYIAKAIEMGFTRNLAERIYRKGHKNFTEFLEVLIQVATSEAPPNNSPIPSAPPPESMNIDDEMAQVRESRLCKICMERQADVLFLPCAQILCCHVCAETVRECPICRSPIESRIRSYFAQS